MKNFVFDLYGTLVDIRTDEHSPEFQNKFLRFVSENYGADGLFFDKFFAALSQYKGFEEPDIVEVIRGAVTSCGGSITEAEAVDAALEFRKLSTQKLGLYAGAKRLLTELKGKGAKVYLLSNAQSVFTVYELKKLGIYSVFDGILLSSDFGEKKPSPKFFNQLKVKFSLDYSQTVFTGNDLTCDIFPARELGIYTVYIKSAISPAEDTLKRAQGVANFAADGFRPVADHLIALCNKKGLDL